MKINLNSMLKKATIYSDVPITVKDAIKKGEIILKEDWKPYIYSIIEVDGKWNPKWKKLDSNYLLSEKEDGKNITLLLERRLLG